jgi:hypothetical protein
MNSLQALSSCSLSLWRFGRLGGLNLVPSKIRELGEFPFTKLRPLSFRVEIASLQDEELHTKKIRVWVETTNTAKIVKSIGFARVIRAYPHLNYVYLETYAHELASLVENDLVRSVWNDIPVKAGDCFGFIEPDSSAKTVAARTQRGTC